MENTSENKKDIEKTRPSEHICIGLLAHVDAGKTTLAESMLYGKALQNIPLAGAVGGAGDFLCLRRVRRYASIKYQKRFLLRRRMEQD